MHAFADRHQFVYLRWARAAARRARASRRSLKTRIVARYVRASVRARRSRRPPARSSTPRAPPGRCAAKARNSTWSARQQPGSGSSRPSH